jgi:plasmid stabilization system protein ParE
MTSRKYKVLIYPAAEQDILEITGYFENALKTSPNNLIQKFYDSIDILETNPFIHPLLQDNYLHQLGYRMFSVDNFLVFYVVKNNLVQIHRFLYGKRDYLQIL